MADRTIASCKRVVSHFQGPRHPSVASNSAMTIVPSPGGPMSFPAPIVPSRKRSAPAEGGPALYGGRNLMPKPTTTLPTDPNRLQSGTQPHSPLIDLPQATGSEHPVRKKRGRPRKADVEERKAQLERQNLERVTATQMPQQTYASPSMATQSPFAAHPPETAHPGPREAPTETSTPQSPQFADVTSTPRNTQQPEGDVNSSSSSSKKKRGRPPKVDTEGIPPPTFSTSASSAGAYGSPPQSGVSVGSVPGRRLSVSTRSQGAGPFQQEQGTQEATTEDLRQQPNRQPRSWNDTVMGSSNPNLRQQQQ
jgi:hypothetical protein